MNQIANLNLPESGSRSVGQAGDSPAERLRGLSMIAEALEAMVRTDVLALGERRSFIDEFELEIDMVLADLLADAATARLSSRSFRALCSAARDCCAALLLAHRSCFGLYGHERFGCVIGRGVIDGAARYIKWQGLARGPAHGAVWAWVDSAVDTLRRGSEQASLQDESVRLAPPELIPVLAILSASYDRVPLRAAPVLDALLARLAPQFSLYGFPVDDYVLAFREGAQGEPVRPAVCDVADRRTHYFSVSMALESVLRCRTALVDGATPAMLGFPEFDTEQLSGALTHLIRCWSPDSARRRSRRHALENDLYLVQGLDAIQLALRDGVSAVLVRARLVDISKHGARMRASSRLGARLDVGRLVAFRPNDGNGWHLGQVQRVWHENEHEVSVGVETLAAHALPARIDNGREAFDAVSWGSFERGGHVRVVLAAGLITENEAISLSVDKRVHNLFLQSVQALHDNAELLVCRII